MAELAGALGLPLLPPITGHFVPGHPLNKQAGEALSQLFREVGSLMSTRMFGNSFNPSNQNILKLSDEELVKFRDVCVSQLGNLAGSDNRARILASYIANASDLITYRDSLRQRREELANTKVAVPPIVGTDDRSEDVTARSGEGAQRERNQRERNHYDTSMFQPDSCAEQYLKARRETVETLQSLSSSQIGQLNRSASSWTPEFREKQYTQLVARLSAMGEKDPNRVEEQLNTLNRPWRDEVNKRYEAFAATRDRLNPGRVDIANKPGNNQGNNQGAEGGSGASTPKGNGSEWGVVVAPELPRAPLDLKIPPFSAETQRNEKESFPAMEPPALPNEGSPINEPTAEAGKYSGRPAETPSKDSNTMRREGKAPGLSELEEVLDSGTTEAIVDNYNKKYGKGAIQSSAVLPALARMEAEGRFGALSAEDVVMELIEGDEGTLATLNTTITSQKVTVLVNALQKRLSTDGINVDPSQIEASVRKKMALSDTDKNKLRLEEVVDRSDVVDLDHQKIKSLVYEATKAAKASNPALEKRQILALVGELQSKLAADGVNVPRQKVERSVVERMALSDSDGKKLKLGDVVDQQFNVDFHHPIAQSIFDEIRQSNREALFLVTDYRGITTIHAGVDRASLNTEYDSARVASAPTGSREEQAAKYGYRFENNPATLMDTWNAVKNQVPIKLSDPIDSSGEPSVMVNPKNGEEKGQAHFLFKGQSLLSQDGNGRGLSVFYYLRMHSNEKLGIDQTAKASLVRIVTDSSFSNVDAMQGRRESGQILVANRAINASDFARDLQTLATIPQGRLYFDGLRLEPNLSRDGEQVYVNGSNKIILQQDRSGHLWLNEEAYNKSIRLINGDRSIPANLQSVVDRIMKGTHLPINLEP